MKRAWATAAALLFLVPIVSFAAVFTRPLYVGMSGSDVSALQQILQDKGYFTYPTITGFYGAFTWKAVAAFQWNNNLDAVGTVGPLTRALLNAAVSSTSASTSISSTAPQTVAATTSSATSTSVSVAATSTPTSTSTSTSTPSIPSNFYNWTPGGGGSGTPDTTPPVISAIATGTPTATSETITWTTNENSTSNVSYGLTTAYGSNSNSASLTTSHSVTLSGLTPNNTYHFAVSSTDGSGNATTSGDYTFATPPSWVMSGANAELDFADSQYYGGTLTNMISDSRNATAYASDNAGDLISFAPNTPRITNQGLLIEGTSTNMIIQSGFASGWSTSGVSLTKNYAVSPDGTADAAFIQEDTSTGSHGIGINSYPAINKGATASTYTLSFYAARAPGSARDLEFFIWDGSFSNQTNVFFNLQTGDSQYGSPSGFSNVNKGCQAVSHSFWHCTFTFTTPATSGLNIAFDLVNSGGDPVVLTYVDNYAGNGSSGVYFYGPQLEPGSFASSYIPTGSATSTRPADIVTLTGAVQTLLASPTGTVVASTTDGESYATADILNNNGTTLLGFNSSNYLTDGITSSLATANTANRLVAYDQSSLAWDPSGRMLALNGGTAAADAVAQTPSGTFYLGSSGSSNFLNGYVSRLALWNTKQSSPQNNFSLVSGTNIFGVGIAGPGDPNATSSVYGFYDWPDASDWSYLQSKGIKLVRLGLSWEDMQPTLGGALNTQYMTYLKTALAGAAADGISVIVDIHNFGHYVNSSAWDITIFTAGNGGASAANVYALGDSNLPLLDFSDLWTKMSTALVGTAGLGGYDIMNEPSGLPATSTWPTAAQDAITAIRTVDSNTPIYVEGNGNDSAGYNAIEWVPPAVTGTHLIYEAHQYFDFDPATTESGPGTYQSTYSSYNTNNYEGIQVLLPWLSWLKVNGVTGDLGEFGVPNDTTDNDAQWLVLQQHAEALLAQMGVQAQPWFYQVQNEGTVGGIRFNPVGGVDDPRLTQMMGQF